MIIAQVQGSRTFIGCLDLGSELVRSLKAVLEDRGIETAFITGYGYLEDPGIFLYSRAEKDYGLAKKHEGMWVAAAIQGSLSKGENDKPDLTLFVEATQTEGGRTKTVAGQLATATVRQFEFLVTTVDNVALKRSRERTGNIQQWLMMFPAGASADAVAMRDETTQQFPATWEDSDQGLSPEEEVLLHPGDWLNHPRLGMCCVVLSDGEERVKCRLSSGRVAELMLSLFRLKAAGVREGGRVYDVEVRKKQ